MITKGIVVRPTDNDGHSYLVWIPTLVGMPNSLEEQEKFRRYQEQQDLSRTTNQDKNSETLLQKLYFSLLKKQVDNSSIQITEEEKKFYMTASVCTVPGVSIKYVEGDVVVVGFIDNSISQPIILGSYMNKKNQVEDLIITRCNSATIGNLVVSEQSSIPDTSNLITQDGSTYKLTKLTDLVKFYDYLSSEDSTSSISLTSAADLLIRLNKVIDKLELISGSTTFDQIFDNK